MKKIFQLILFWVVASGTHAQQSRPNIVLIMADDLGFSDIGVYGSEIDTPNLDSLAANGIRLKQFYNTGRCCPSRAALMTGMYPHNAGMGYMNGFDQGVPGYRGDLSRSTMTIAEALRQSGYSNYMVGKWHLATDTKPKGPQDNWPMQRGFDRYFGTLIGSGSYFTPKSLTYGNTTVKPQDGFYLTDAISDSASTFINDHASQKSKDPFFLYVAYTAPHWPLHAKRQDILKYMKLYETGWDELRDKRYEKQLKLGVIDKGYALSKRIDTVPAWKDIPVQERAIWVKRMAIYAAQIDCMDQGIGRILEALKINKLDENTMVIFMADNGGCAEFLSTMDPAIETLGSDASYESYRGHWANMSNTPFRLFKTRLHEGGIHTPFILRWPGHTATKGTVIDNAPAHIIDLMPTFLEAGGMAYPRAFNNAQTRQLNGISLLPIFKGETLSSRALYWEHQANRAIRLNGWKLVSQSTEQSPYTQPWELYNLKKDKTEQYNLALKYPEKVKELEAVWNKWANENNVFPLNGTDLKNRGFQFKRN